jgi:hypothetical protein
VIEHAAVVDVRGCEADGQRDAAMIHDQVPFAAGFAAVGGVGTRVLAPLLAGTRAASTLVRLQSIWPAAPSGPATSGSRRPTPPPVAQASPASHPRPTADLGREPLPADAGLEDEEDPGQGGTVWHARAPPWAWVARAAAASRRGPRGRRRQAG